MALPMTVGGGVSSFAECGVRAPALRSDTVRSLLWEMERGSLKAASMAPARASAMTDSSETGYETRSLPTTSVGCNSGGTAESARGWSESVKPPSRDSGTLCKNLRRSRLALDRPLLLRINASRRTSWLRTVSESSRTSRLSGEWTVIWSCLTCTSSFMERRIMCTRCPPSALAAPRPESSAAGGIRSRKSAASRVNGHLCNHEAKQATTRRSVISRAVSARSPRACWRSCRKLQRFFGCPSAKPPFLQDQPCCRRMRRARGE
mmetsp:Transcript_89052/g.247420  ORF Transcript_89052/g.247420 Transcript_89052/m.247420 type:complete len:263 (-) Transcript_89052:699-1487(-)